MTKSGEEILKMVREILLEARTHADHSATDREAVVCHRILNLIERRLDEYLRPGPWSYVEVNNTVFDPDREVSADSTFDQAAERPQGLLDSGGWMAIVSNGSFLMTNPSYLRKGKVVGLLCQEFGTNEIAAAFYNLGAYNEARRQAAIESPKEKT